MLVNMKTLLQDAKKNQYGIPAANAWNESTVKAAIATAEARRSPLILALYPAMADILEFGAIAIPHASRAQVPVVVHLDHGQEFADAVKAVRAGFTSLMVDRSTCPFEQNVAEVREIVKIAHTLDMSVEAELGHVGKGSEYHRTKNDGLTDPGEAERFVAATGIDCLAVAVGTSHGLYSGTPEIHFDLLARLSQVVPVPLVLHGCSGTGDENLQKAIQYGITKLNLYTDLDQAGYAVLDQSFIQGKAANMLQAEAAMTAGYAAKLGYYMELFGSQQRV
ncbi:class II fructose-bisphosphate aldolase [Propionispora hippei]|uniref:Fructose-bisphosphate aldolase, class II n=1 Tax=Propionispora hippei DSM 15287 TaxID=1123003 RepID=A0A1M6JHG4_9FIRM|nr:class II fructose-bisphosphate aldolase [Propionispora hippei]SHJ46072.1 fructose-bisphosphate aldolase, class II [Propionispora hippei DSM 15287]